MNTHDYGTNLDGLHSTLLVIKTKLNGPISEQAVTFCI